MDREEQLHKGGNGTDQKGQQKHPSKEKQDWRDEDNISQRERGDPSKEKQDWRDEDNISQRERGELC